jgi:hypothetical protein
MRTDRYRWVAAGLFLTGMVIELLLVITRHPWPGFTLRQGSITIPLAALWATAAVMELWGVHKATFVGLLGALAMMGHGMVLVIAENRLGGIGYVVAGLVAAAATLRSFGGLHAAHWGPRAAMVPVRRRRH